jgi:hypothetical protein
VRGRCRARQHEAELAGGGGAGGLLAAGCLGSRPLGDSKTLPAAGEHRLGLTGAGTLPGPSTRGRTCRRRRSRCSPCGGRPRVEALARLQHDAELEPVASRGRRLDQSSAVPSSPCRRLSTRGRPCVALGQFGSLEGSEASAMFVDARLHGDVRASRRRSTRRRT